MNAPPPGEPESESPLIDAFLPRFDVSAAYQKTMTASPSVIFRVLREGDLGNSWIVRFLITLRSIPRLVKHPQKVASRRDRMTLEDLAASGFHILGERSESEIVIGVVGRFWKLTDNVNQEVSAPLFKSFAEPGYCKAAWNFRLQRVDSHRTCVTTETRIQALDVRSRRLFKLYWLLVGPFSGLIRIILLRDLQKQCEIDRYSGLHHEES